MKKSNQTFDVTVSKNCTDSTQNLGTRSSVANFVRQLLEGAESDKTITLTILPKAVAAEAAPAEPTKTE